MSGFSISNNLMANEVNLELSEHQQSLGTSVRDLSSGLRVNTAADDPSGNAIATSLQTHAQAFNQASQNVTNAQNTGAVADGALAAVTDVLLRIRELAVGAASTVGSSSDRVNIQAEISQLLLEINRIAQNTNFNGRSLLDGSIAGYQPAQSAQAIVTANSVLLSSGTNASGSSDLLLATGTLYNDAIQPQLVFQVQQAVTASTNPQTVEVSETQYIQPGSVFTLNGALVTVKSVDAANGTITAIFSGNAASGDVANSVVNGALTAPVSVGTHLVTLAPAAVAQPLYAGEVLQIAPGSSATNDVVVVQQVMSSTSFIATFTKSQLAGVEVYGRNEMFMPANFGPGVFTWNYGGTATDGAPISSTAYVIESSSGGTPPANGSTTQIVATGTVVGGGLKTTSVYFSQKIPDLFGGAFQIYTALGLGAVVNQSGTIGVQETFYGTATQQAVTSSTLLAPGERAMLYDGVVTTLGDFGAADVGSTAYIKVLQSVAAITSTNNPALQVQSGADEGDVIQIGIPAVNTNTLRISTATVIGASGADSALASEDTIGQMDYALQQVTTVRAQIGAEIVRLGVDQTNDDTTATELTASQSNITDLNVGSATTDFTEQQIDIDVATSLLQQVSNLPDEILKLFQPPSAPP
ncbi:MAG: flagellin [Candidatus Aquilonibacter sp.]